MSRRLTALSGMLLLAFVLAVQSLQAQAPQVQYGSPSHVTTGSSSAVELFGKQVDRVESWYFSQPGIEAEIGGKGKATITVAADAPLGDVDVWLKSNTGLAAPLRMSIGEFPTRTESEPNNTSAEAQELELPVTVGGRIEPGTDGDWFRVQLTAGDGLTLACRSATLGGTLQPTLIVFDPHGRELAHDTLTQLEPVVHVEAAEAGSYTVGVQDRSYRSTPSPFYQLSLTTGPWLVGAYPPTLHAGQSQQVTLYGYRLPMSEPYAANGPLRRQTVELTAPDQSANVERGWNLTRALFVNTMEYRQPMTGGSVRFELLDRALHDAAVNAATSGPEGALRRELPFEIVNRFGSPREVVHWYRFSAEAGKTYWLEAVSERIGRACDLELIIHDATGKPLTTFGDVPTPKELAAELPLDTRDPSGAWKAPADGDYLLAVRDLLSVAGRIERGYRLSVGKRLEDVRVVAQVPKSGAAAGWSVKAGGRLAISLVAVRRGGHEGPIEVQAAALPPDVPFKIPPVTIAVKKSTASLTITADKDAGEWTGPIRLVATTDVNGKSTTVDVRAASVTSTATPVVSRLLDELVIGVMSTKKK